MTETKSVLPVWPFWLGDVLLLGLAFRIDSLGHRPLLWSEALLLVLCGAGAAGCLIFPILRRHNDEHALNQAQLLAQATSQIQNLDHVAALVTGATNQWREYQEEASKTAVTAKGVAESMAAEAKSFTEFIQRANDIEKAHLRLEVEKLRRAEAEWLQICPYPGPYLSALSSRPAVQPARFGRTNRPFSKQLPRRRPPRRFGAHDGRGRRPLRSKTASTARQPHSRRKHRHRRHPCHRIHLSGPTHPPALGPLQDGKGMPGGGAAVSPEAGA